MCLTSQTDHRCLDNMDDRLKFESQLPFTVDRSGSRFQVLYCWGHRPQSLLLYPCTNTHRRATSQLPRVSQVNLLMHLCLLLMVLLNNCPSGQSLNFKNFLAESLVSKSPTSVNNRSLSLFASDSSVRPSFLSMPLSPGFSYPRKISPSSSVTSSVPSSVPSSNSKKPFFWTPPTPPSLINLKMNNIRREDIQKSGQESDPRDPLSSASSIRVPLRSFLFEEAVNDGPSLGFESAGYSPPIRPKQDHHQQQMFPSNGLHLNQRMNSLEQQISSLGNQLKGDEISKKNDMDTTFKNHPNIINSVHDQMPSGSFEKDFEKSFDFDHYHEKPPKVIIKKVKVKSKPKVIYKIKKVYIPKPIPFVKKVKVIKKVPVKKIVIKTKIKKVPVIKKVKIIKKVKVPVPVKVKYIKVKKIKVPVIKKVKVPVIRKVVKFIPKTKSVKHIHMHKVTIMKGKKKKKKKKKFKKLKKLIKKMKKKKYMKLKAEMHDDCNSHRRMDCMPYCMPLPTVLPTMTPTAIPGLPMIPGVPGIPGLPMIPGLPGGIFGRKKRSVNDTRIHIGEKSPLNETLIFELASSSPAPDALTKRFGFFRRNAAECEEPVVPEPDEEVDDADGGGLSSMLNPFSGVDGNNDEDDIMKRRRRRRREIHVLEKKQRRLERSLLLGPRIRFFDHEGWSFFGETRPFSNSLT